MKNGVDNISLRKRMALNIWAKKRDIEILQHQLNYLMWESTLRCNLSCKHCGSDCKQDSSQKDMPLADFLKVVDSIKPHVDSRKTMIVITGGEPLMRKDLEKCGLELYKREFPWGIVTNGFALTNSRVESLLDSGMNSITISLDGLEEAHNTMRGNNQSFEKAYNAIKYVASKGDELVFDVVSCITSQTYNQMNQIKELLIDAGVRSWRLFTVFPIGRASDNDELQLSPQQFKGFFDFIKESRKDRRIEVMYGCEGFLGSYEGEVRDELFFCRAGVRVGSVLVDGSISACPNLRSNFIQGNIYRDDFMDIWSNKFQPHRDRSWTKTGECADCKQFRYCQGNGMHLRGEEGELLFCHYNRIKEGETI